MWQQFSAAVSAPSSSMNQCISDGASVSGASMNSNVRPSMSSFCPVSVIVSVGAISVIVPREIAVPRPRPKLPFSSNGTSEPYW